jgi:8-oxo-dGTP pyrophosphatase MutT (NUDIX family)
VTAPRFRQAARALIVDDDDAVLLVRFVFPGGAQRWALPGGGLDPGEADHDGLRRELREELGLTDVEIGPHVWSREHVIPMVTGHDGQRDRIYLVRRPHFDPHPEIGWERLRAEFVHEMRWWTLDELDAATRTADAGEGVPFAPARLATLYHRLLTEGPPAAPIDTGI